MSTSTLLLNYLAMAVLSIVVASISILVPLRLDRPHNSARRRADASAATTRSRRVRVDAAGARRTRTVAGRS